MVKLDPRADLTLTLVKVARLYRQGVDAALSEMGLSDALALPVVLLGRRPDGMRQNQLAEELGVEGPSLVRLLDRLVADGLVERREDPADRRAKIVQLTPAGLVHSRRASQVVDRYRACLLAGVSEAEVQAMRAVLHRLEGELTIRREGPRP